MSRTAAILVLMLAAALEAGGDAILRAGIHTNVTSHRIMLFGLAALVLFSYGWTVNATPWDFGKLLGHYVVFFFVFAQVTSWFIFKQVPSLLVLMGGGFIIVGGVIISFSNA